MKGTLQHKHVTDNQEKYFIAVDEHMQYLRMKFEKCVKERYNKFKSLIDNDLEEILRHNIVHLQLLK